MDIIPFQQGDGLGDPLALLPVVAAVIVVVAFMMWALAWLSRYFEYLKSVESRWVDAQTLDFVRRVLEGVWLVLMAIAVLAIAATQSALVRDILVAVLLRVPALFFAIFVVFAASLVVRVLRRFAAFLRGELKTKPRRAAPPQALAFTEIVLKYVIYLGALAVAILGGLRALPPGDQEFIAANIGAVPALDPAAALAVVVALVAVILADRFVSSILDDMKRRSTKFPPQVVEDVRTIARYAVWLIGAIVVLFVFLDLVLPAERLLVVTVGFVGFLLTVTVLAFDPVRNALSGITLMRADPFDVGDRVKIGDDLVCDVVAMGLTMTQVRTLRGEQVNLPNTRLLQLPIMNFSRSRPSAIFVEVAVGFAVDHARVRDLLLRAAGETRGVVAAPAPEAFGKEMNGGSIVYQLLAYTDDPARMKEIKSSLIWRIQDLFREAKITPTGAAAPPSPPSAG